MGSIVHFQQVEAWQEAHKLVLLTYRVTKGFPGDERFGLVSQMRRAAISIPANIAEGFKRRGIQDRIRSYSIAEGSLAELKYFSILSKALEYSASADHLMSQSQTVVRLLYGLVASTNRRERSRGKRVHPSLLTPCFLLPFAQELLRHRKRQRGHDP